MIRMHRRRDGIGSGPSEGLTGLERRLQMPHHCALRLEPLPALRAIAPTQSEPAFVIAQLAALVLFIVLGIVAVVASRREAAA
jgi:hypothetical protein